MGLSYPEVQKKVKAIIEIENAEYAKQIVNGLKTIELRRKFPLFKKRR